MDALCSSDFSSVVPVMVTLHRGVLYGNVRLMSSSYITPDDIQINVSIKKKKKLISFINIAHIKSPFLIIYYANVALASPHFKLLQVYISA